MVQGQFNGLPCPCLLDHLSIRQDREDTALRACHLVAGEPAFRQIQTAVHLCRFAGGEFARGLRLLALRLHGLLKTRFVERESAFLGNIARQVNRESIGIPQPEYRLARNTRFSARLQVGDVAVQDRQPVVQGLLEAFLFLPNRLNNEILLGAEFGIVPAHLMYDRPRHLGEERSHHAHFLGKAHRTSHHHAQYVRRANVARQHAVGEQKCHRPAMVGNHAVGNMVALARRVVVPQDFLDRVHQRRK